MPKITIDGREVEVPAGTNLIEAARTLDLEIPHFCYHPGLSVAGNCRMCLVEIEKVPKLQIACNTPVAEGMSVITTSERVKKARAGVMEFLLLNHPIDCPICDCAGECYLQDYYMDHDLKSSRHEDPKNKKQKAQPIGEHVMLDKERCVLCSRCVRFTDEVSKTFELGIFGRGSTEEIGLAPGQTLDNAYSGCVVDLCPVGALTDREFRFKSRPWFLKETETVCTGCAMGCNVVLDTNTNPYNKVGEDRAYRLFPRENKAVNGYWMCDEGRYSYKAIDHGRKTVATLQGREIPLDAALNKLAEQAGSMIQAAPARAAFLLSSHLTNESLFAFKRLADSLGVAQVEFGDDLKTMGTGDTFLIQPDKSPNSRGASDLGVGPRAGVLGGKKLLEAAEAGAFDVLFIVGHSFASARMKALAAKVKVLVGLHSHQQEGLDAFTVDLPLAVAAEQDGTFTNVQGRVQRNRKALEPLGDSLPGYVLAQRLGMSLGTAQSEDGPAALFQAWAKGRAALASTTLDSLGAPGLALNPPVPLDPEPVMSSMLDSLAAFLTASPFLVQVIAAVIKTVFMMTVVMLIGGLILSWVERKQSAIIQDRIGANRASIFGVRAMGLFHNLADAAKGVLKEDFIPPQANAFLHTLAPFLAVCTAVVAFSVLPFGGTVHLFGQTIDLTIAPLPVGILFVWAMMGMGVYGVILAGYVSNNKYSMLGCLRASAQVISYEVATGLTILGALIFYHSLDLRDMVQWQMVHSLCQIPGLGWLPAWIPAWGVFLQPLGFILFFTATIVEMKRIPFDLPEGESEIIGYSIEYSGMKFMIFMMSEFVESLLFAWVVVLIFFGGWHVPGLSLPASGGALFFGHALPYASGVALETASMALKIVFFLWLQMLVRWSLPRFRYDQIMHLGWKIMLPLALVNLVVTAGLCVLLK